MRKIDVYFGCKCILDVHDPMVYDALMWELDILRILRSLLNLIFGSSLFVTTSFYFCSWKYSSAFNHDVWLRWWRADLICSCSRWFLSFAVCTVKVISFTHSHWNGKGAQIAISQVCFWFHIAMVSFFLF